MPDQRETREKTERVQQFAVRLSFWGAVILFLIPAVAGIAVDSITLLLDAAGSLVILVVALLMRVSIKKVHQPPDEVFNFGYEKYEPLTVAVQGGLIIATCVISAKFAIQDIIHAEDIKNFNLPVIATFISAIIGVSIAFFIRRSARRTNSVILHTASTHWFIDTGLSLGMFGGFLFGLIMRDRGYTNITPYVDPVMALVLAVIFIQSPLKTVMRNTLELLDMVPGKEIQEKVRKVVDEYKPKSFGVHRLRSRKAGEKIFVDICFVVKPDLSIVEVEDLANSFEKDIKTNLPRSDVVVYFKPGKGRNFPN